jgi:hypothetical protein
MGLRTTLIAALLLLLAPFALAIPVEMAKDLDDLLERAPMILVAELAPRPGVRPTPPPDTPEEVEINVLAVLKGDARTGLMRYTTLMVLRPGERYVLFGRWSLMPSRLILSPRTDLKSLEGKSLREQVLLLAKERREYIEHAISVMEGERARIDELTGTPPAAESIGRAEALRLAAEVVFDRVKIPAGTAPKLEETQDTFVVTYPNNPAPGTLGADYHARVTIDKRSGRVIKVLGGS